MSKFTAMATCVAVTAALTACRAKVDDTFDYHVDRFEDIEVLRYKVPGFENLTLDQKKLVYHLTEAALAGRDILWDQNCKYNL
ncbi:MAG: dihydrofolate reductase, partial [Muribaculaceae bacterium]|nr:dihydrofolate reductase [Muribaculaceae bacterium]